MKNKLLKLIINICASFGVIIMVIGVYAYSRDNSEKILNLSEHDFIYNPNTHTLEGYLYPKVMFSDVDAIIEDNDLIFFCQSKEKRTEYYWIIDEKNDSLIGPLTLNKYKAFCDSIGSAKGLQIIDILDNNQK